MDTVKILGEAAIPEEAVPYMDKKINGFDFIVTRKGVAYAMQKCGAEALRKFFANGIDSEINGKKVSEYLAGE
jgi:hypothetical protein